MRDNTEIKNAIRKWLKTNPIKTPFLNISLSGELGEGGTAIVFESGNCPDLAVKVLAEPIRTPPTDRYCRFLDEYWRTVTLPPNDCVVRLFHFGEVGIGENQLPYIVMERCQETLDKRYKASPLRSLDEFQKLLDRLLMALDFIHSKGIVHRDIKPKNLLFRANDQLVIADFGIQWFEDELLPRQAETRNDDRLANFGFSAPEQSRPSKDNPPAPRMDLFALGQTLYYCVTGTTISGTGHKRLADVNIDLSPFDPIIDKLVANEPLERFQSVADVQAYLERQKQEEASNSWYFGLEEQFSEMERQTNEFSRRISSTKLAPRVFTRLTNPTEVDLLLEALATDCQSYELWWRYAYLHPEVLSNHEVQGMDDNHNSINEFRKLQNDTWLINGFEIQVAEACICRDRNYKWRHFVVLQLKPMPPFFPKASGSSDNSYTTQAGYAQGQYVPFDLYDLYENPADNLVMLDGREIDLSAPDSNRRTRFLKTAFMFLAPCLSVIIHPESDPYFRAAATELCRLGRIEEEALASLYGLNPKRAPLPDYIKFSL
jgi:serine/threonine protein kinase